MTVSESQSGSDIQQEEVLTLAEAAAYLRVSEEALADLADRNGVPARKIGDDWRFLRKALNYWLVARGHPHAEGLLVAQHWLLASPFTDELLAILEDRLLRRLKPATPARPKPGSREAVLEHFGVFGEEDDLEERLADARKRREAEG